MVGFGSPVLVARSLLPSVGASGVKQRRISRPRAKVVANCLSPANSENAGGTRVVRARLALGLRIKPARLCEMTWTEYRNYIRNSEIRVVFFASRRNLPTLRITDAGGATR